MTLKEIKKKVLQLIEEIDDKHAKLTSDPDIAAKLNSVINQVQFELARMKKIPANTTEDVTADEIFDLRIERAGKNTIQLSVKDESDDTMTSWKITEPYSAPKNALDQYISEQILSRFGPITENVLSVLL